MVVLNYLIFKSDRPVPPIQKLFDQNSYQKRRKNPLWYRSRSIIRKVYVVVEIQDYRSFYENVWGGQRLQKKKIVSLILFHLMRKKCGCQAGIIPVEIGGNYFFIKQLRKLYEFQTPSFLSITHFLSQPENSAIPSSAVKIPNSISHYPWKRFCSSTSIHQPDLTAVKINPELPSEGLFPQFPLII